MQLEFNSSQKKFRQEIRSFLEETLGSEWDGILPDTYFTEENFPKNEIPSALSQFSVNSIKKVSIFLSPVTSQVLIK